jgi:ribonuclease HI
MGRVLGRATNNEAEYRALIAALEAARELGAEEVEVLTDSELLQRQLLGRYRVRAPNLKPLFAEARRALGSFPRWSVRHVPREENREADRLANLALDLGSDVDE